MTGCSSTKEACRCNCGYTCGRRCGLDIDACMDQHYKKDCDHVWDGPWIEEEFGGTSSCKCGTKAIDHDMMVGP